jgi:hypothetical protein
MILGPIAEGDFRRSLLLSRDGTVSIFLEPNYLLGAHAAGGQGQVVAPQARLNLCEPDQRSRPASSESPLAQRFSLWPACVLY